MREGALDLRLKWDALSFALRFEDTSSRQVGARPKVMSRI
jgi:hypothetical protein